MSILLIIEREIDGATVTSTYPLSTEDVFNAVWLQGAEKIGAQWIPLFSSGVPLDQDDIPAVCDELRALQNWVSTASPNPVHEYISTRIEMTIEALQATISLVPRPTTIWIG